MNNLLIFIRIVFSMLMGFIISYLLTKKMIKKGDNRQVERNYLDSHQVKNGTVSGGGLAFFLATVIAFFLASIGMKFDFKIFALLFCSSSFFLIGFADDYFKKKYKSYGGLSARFRILLEVVVLIYLIIILKDTSLDLKSLYLPILKKEININHIYILFLGFVLIGTSNSINLSDGLDGLASGLVMICLSPFVLLALVNKEYLLSIYIASLIGAIMAFLYFNFHPAKIFMGDCGSLYLGATLATISIILRNEVILFISGFLFVLEALSVIIQVLHYKRTRKRIFLMTPLHHHFEKKGIEETRVVMGFYLVGIFLGIFSLIVEVI